MNVLRVLNIIKKNKFASDSLWAVFGNGFGNALLLLAGIIIARFLGRDLYGEYGMVKSTMFVIAGFATFGLGWSSTRFIAQYEKENNHLLHSVGIASLAISIFTSTILCLLLFFFSHKLADYLDQPQLYFPFRILGIIIVIRAVSTVTTSLLAGFKSFKESGVNNILSGIAMLALSIPLTYYFSLTGALLSLLISQAIFCCTNLWTWLKIDRKLEKQITKNLSKEILLFSFPVALQELSYSLCNWGVAIAITKYASLGEMGIYSATAQWNSVVLFIPGLLFNVFLSYMSSSKSDVRIMKKSLLINFLTAVIPFLLILIFSDYIVKMYGESFNSMKIVLNIMVFSTIFNTLSNSYVSELLAQGRNWTLFLLRLFKDFSIFLLILLDVRINNGTNAALHLAIITVVSNFVFLILLILSHKRYEAKCCDYK